MKRNVVDEFLYATSCSVKNYDNLFLFESRRILSI